jgi:hypothetical protein
MSTELLRREQQAEVTGIAALRQMVLKAVISPHTRRNYAKALDEIFAFSELRKQPLSRDLLMEYRAQMIGIRQANAH